MIRVTARFAFVEAGLDAWPSNPPTCWPPEGGRYNTVTRHRNGHVEELLRGIIAEQEFVVATLGDWPL